jgi:hypothetical protein
MNANTENALLEIKRILQANNNLKDAPYHTGLARIAGLVEAALEEKDWNLSQKCFGDGQNFTKK